MTKAGLESDTYEVHGRSVTRMRCFRSYLVGCVHWILAEVLYSKFGMSAVVVMHLIRESAGLRACSPAILGNPSPEQAKVDPANRGASLALDPSIFFFVFIVGIASSSASTRTEPARQSNSSQQQTNRSETLGQCHVSVS
jgi:hypothetical protein